MQLELEIEKAKKQVILTANYRSCLWFLF